MKVAILFGLMGGLFVSLASIVVEDSSILRRYLELYEVYGRTAFLGLGIRTFLLMSLGALWVWMMKELNSFKAFQLGIAAPVALAALLGVSINSDSTEVPININNPSRVQTFDAIMAGLQARNLSTAELGALVPIAAKSNDEIATLFSDSDIRGITLSLVEKFSGPDRRKASNAIGEMYKENGASQQEEIVKTLLESTEKSGRYAYRKNVYILRTLGLFETWNCPKETQLCDNFGRLVQFTNDPTFQQNFKVAESRKN